MTNSLRTLHDMDCQEFSMLPAAIFRNRAATEGDAWRVCLKYNISCKAFSCAKFFVA